LAGNAERAAVPARDEDRFDPVPAIQDDEPLLRAIAGAMPQFHGEAIDDRFGFEAVDERSREVKRRQLGEIPSTAPVDPGPEFVFPPFVPTLSQPGAQSWAAHRG